MARKTNTILSIVASFLMLCVLWVSCGAATAAEKQTLKGTVNQNEITDRLEGFGIKSVIHVAGKNSTIYVDSVRMGSKAFYKGVEAGDVVRGLVQKDDNTFHLNIERKGAQYQIIFAGVAEKSNLDPVKKDASIDADKEPAKEKVIEKSIDAAPEPREKALLKYDIEILIDISGSMKQVDGTDGVSKFEWCHRQIMDLADRLRPYQKRLAITTFNDQFFMEENCSVDEVERVFATTVPEKGTDLLAPLESAMRRGENRGLVTGKRSMIVVITDGLPNIPSDPTSINHMITRFTQHLSYPDQILIVVLQVGNTFDGRTFCKNLDDDLVAEGAKYDIVDTQTFSELKNNGLTNVLVDSIVEEKLARLHKNDKKPLSDLSSDADLQQLKKERAQIEKQLMGN